MRHHGFAVSLMSFALVLAGSPAWAADWSPPVSGASITVPFGVSGPGGVHRGVDMPAEPGAQVRAPSAGTVLFAGVVPADGGGTCGAVTIQTPDGYKISLIPLDGVQVSEGAPVRAGDTVGRLAASGDDSSDASHLHLGLRKGDQYIDPAPLLSFGGQDEPGAPSGAELPAPVPAGGSTESAPVGGSPAGDPIASAAPATSAVHAPASNGDAAPVEMPAETPAGRSVQSPALAAGSCDAAAGLGIGQASVDAADVVTASAAGVMRVLRDVGVPVSAGGELRASDAAAVSAATRWVPVRRLGGSTGAVPGSPAAVLSAIAMIACGVVPLIARSRAFVRAR